MASSPRTIAAVDAGFASTHDVAATVTVRHTSRAGRPVLASTTWWTVSPPRDHRRTVVLDVASPPTPIRTLCLGSGSSRCESARPMLQPFIGASPATAMSPPRLTSTPHRVISVAATAARSAASAFAVAPRSSRRPIGTRMRELVRSISTNRPPGRRVRTHGRGSARQHGREVSVISEHDECLAHGRIDVAVGERGCSDGDLDRVDEQRQHLDPSARRSVHALDLGVVAEPAARHVERRELRSDGLMSFLTRARYFPCLFLILARIFGLLGGRKRDGATGGGRAELNATPGIRSRRYATACPRARSRNSGRTLCRTVACLPRTAARTRRSCPAPSPGRS